MFGTGIPRDRKWASLAKRRGEGGAEYCSVGMGFLFWGDGNVLKLDNVEDFVSLYIHSNLPSVHFKR
jgi:hypothetical protein